MIRLAANLSMLFTELPFIERFGAAARAGFRGVEYLFPYTHAPEALRQQLETYGLSQVLFNLPPGDWAAGERGLTSLPGREREFRASVDLAVRYAETLSCPRLHAMAGRIPPDADDALRRAHTETYIGNLRYAADALASVGKTLLIEPINQRDMPGYYLSHQSQARDIVERVGADNLAIQFDMYHCQVTEGDVTRRMDAQFDRIGHVQVAGVPARHEPDEGELNYRALLAHLDALGYSGWVGCEYNPRGVTRAGLGWGHAFGLTTG